MQVYDIGFSGLVVVLNPCLKSETWGTQFVLTSLVGLFDDCAAFYDGVDVFEDFDVLEAGSALASDLIWHELEIAVQEAGLRQHVGRGGQRRVLCVHGSPKTYAQPGTLTGSIGVVGGKTNLGPALDNIGVKTDTSCRGANAIRSLSASRTRSAILNGRLYPFIRDVYDQFLDRHRGVDGGRQEVRQGDPGEGSCRRTCLDGTAGCTRGLADEMGGLPNFVAAAWKAGLMPAVKPPELLMLGKNNGFPDQSRHRPFRRRRMCRVRTLAGGVAGTASQTGARRGHVVTASASPAADAVRVGGEVGEGEPDGRRPGGMLRTWARPARDCGSRTLADRPQPIESWW